MACKWIYKGLPYTENQFIAIMANEYLNKPTAGQRMEAWGRELEQKVDDFFKQNPTLSSIIPPQLVKAALKSAAKLVIAGGKIHQAVEHAIKYIQNNITDKLNDIQVASMRDMLKTQVNDGINQFYEKLNQTQSGTQAARELFDVMFDGLETLIDEAKDRVEVKAAIFDFVEANKHRITNLSQQRILNLFAAAIKADYKSDAKHFIQKANKLLQKQELFDAINQAAERQDKVRKSIGKFTNLQEDIKDFLNIDVDDLAAIDPNLLHAYNKALEGLVERGVKDVEAALNLLPNLAIFQTKLSGRRVTGMNANIDALSTVTDLRNFLNNLIATPINDLEELRNFNRTLSMLTTRAAELLSDANTNQNQKDYQDILDFIQNELPNALGKNPASQKLRNEIEVLKEQAITKALNIKHPNKTFGVRNTAINEFFGWTKDDLMKLTPAEVLTYLATREAVQVGYIPPQLHELNNKVATLKNVETLFTETNEVAKSFAGLTKFQQLVSKALFNPTGKPQAIKDKLTVKGKQHWDAMFGTEGKRTFWKTVLNPLHRAFTEVTKSNAKDMANLQLALRELKSFKNKHISDSNTDAYNRTMSKLGIIMAQLDYQSNFTGWDDLPDNKKDLFAFVSGTPTKIDKVPTDKLKIDEEAYQQLVKNGSVINGVLNPTEAISRLPLEEQRVIKEFQKMLDSVKEKARLMTEKRGDPFNEQKNYWPRQVISSFNDVEEANSALAAANVATKEAIGTRAAATKQRVEKATNYYNFNLEQVAKKHVRQVNQDFHLTDEIKRALGSLKQTAKKLQEQGLIDQANQILGIENAIEDGLRAELSSQYLLGQADLSFAKNVLRSGRNLTLSNPTRMVTELLSNLIRNASLNPLSDIREIAWEPVLDDLGSSVYLKGNKHMFESREASHTTLSKINDAMMQFADSVAASQMWKTEFKDSFKELTGQDFDPKQYFNPQHKETYRQQIATSAEIAEMAVNKYYNAQSGFAAPSKFQWAPGSTPISRENIVAKVFGYMNSFAANEALLARASLKSLAEGNYSKGTKQLTKLVASNYAFSLLSITAGSALKAFFDDEDDDFLEFIEKTFEPFNEENFGTTMENAAISTVASMALGRFSNLFRVTSGVGMGFLTEASPENETVQYANKVLKDVFYIKPTIFASHKQDPKNRFDYVMENVAPGLGMGLSDIIEGIGAASHLGMDAIEGKDVKTSDLLLLSKAGLYGLSHMSGGIPAGAIGKRYLNQKVSEAIKSEKYNADYDNYYEEALKRGLNKLQANKYANIQMDRKELRNELKKQGVSAEEIQEELDKKFPLP